MHKRTLALVGYFLIATKKGLKTKLFLVSSFWSKKLKFQIHKKKLKRSFIVSSIILLFITIFCLFQFYISDSFLIRINEVVYDDISLFKINFLFLFIILWVSLVLIHYSYSILIMNLKSKL